MDIETEEILLYFGAGAAIIGAVGYLIWRDTPAGFYVSIQDTINKAIETTEQNAKSFFDILESAYNIPKALIASVIKQESNGNPKAVSSEGAIGLMQIMPSTGLSECNMTKEQLFEPTNNMICGTSYLSSLYKQYRRLDDAVAAYYAGPKAVTYRQQYGTYPSYGSPPVYKYVQQVMNSYNELQTIMV